MRFATAMGAAFLASLFLAVGSAAAAATIGAPAPAFSLQDQDGKTVNLSDFSGKIVVLEWVNPNCPYVQRHYAAKTMATLADRFSGKGVVWLAINSTSSADNSTNKAWIAKNSLSYPILNDSDGKAGHAYGAKTTPDMFVIDRNGNLAYSGGIDNDPEGDKSSDRVNYVDKALSEILAGQPVATPRTKSYGCSVKYAH